MMKQLPERRWAYRIDQQGNQLPGGNTNTLAKGQKEKFKMAKNWKVGEAVVAIQSGSTEDKLDIGRRFPLFAILAAQTNEAGVTLLNCVPEYVTARKIESVLKGELQEGSEDGGGNEDEDEKPATKKQAKAPAKSNDDELEGKSPKELFAIAQELGVEVEPKKTADYYIKAIKKHQEAEAKKAAAAKNKGGSKKAAEEEEDWGDDEEETKPAKGKGSAKKASEEEDDDWDL